VRKINGIGIIKKGKYSLLSIDGVGLSISNLIAKKINVQGVFLCKSFFYCDNLHVQGYLKTKETEFANILEINGDVNVERCEDIGRVAVYGHGKIVANTLQCGYFHLIGYCKIKFLKAFEIAIYQEENDKQKNKKLSVKCIECNKLVAYNLIATRIIAKEVQLYGKCEIDTLVCENLIDYNEECIIKNYVKKNKDTNSLFEQ